MSIPEPAERCLACPNPTFEPPLPAPSCPDVSIDPTLLTKRYAPTRREGQPFLVCKFCEEIKTYDRTTRYWEHLTTYDEKERSELTEEIRRSAAEWKKYWEELNTVANTQGSTWEKVLQAEDKAFGWEDIKAWFQK